MTNNLWKKYRYVGMYQNIRIICMEIRRWGVTCNCLFVCVCLSRLLSWGCDLWVCEGGWVHCAVLSDLHPWSDDMHMDLSIQDILTRIVRSFSVGNIMDVLAQLRNTLPYQFSLGSRWDSITVNWFQLVPIGVNWWTVVGWWERINSQNRGFA